MANEHIHQKSAFYASEIKSIAAQLAKIPTVKRTMPEYVFAKVFLPMFAGDENPEYEPTYSRWAELAGNIYAEMDVIDANGTVLFTVPPVVNRDTINPAMELEDGARPLASFFTIAATYQQLLSYNPNQAEMFLEAELTKRPLLMNNPESIKKDFQRWNDIFARYGRKLVPMKGLQKSGSAPAADDDDDYEFQTL